MKSLHKLLRPWVGAVSACLVLAAACAKAPLKSESVLDTPQTHVDQGLRLLDRGDEAGAGVEFHRALAMDPKFYLAHAAKALLLAKDPEKGKVAVKTAEEAVEMADNRWQAWMIQARVLATVQPEDWHEDAVKSLEKAAELKAPAEQVHYWRGQVAMQNLDFASAVAAFGQAVAQRGEWSTPADNAMEQCNKILRARPGSRVSSRIALQEEIDRADMAVLLVEELKLPEVMAKRKPVEKPAFSAPGKDEATPAPTSPADIQEHWAKSWIEDVLKAGGMATGPGGAFQPEEMLSRGEFAMTVVEILVAVSGNTQLASEHFGENSVFPDMNSSHPAYNAAAVCTSRGILQADLQSGRFDVAGKVNGADALLSLRQFQNILRQNF